MADKWPLANGNWSTAANWNGGTLPVDGDDIYMDGKVVTLDQDINLPTAKLRGDLRTGGTVGGALSIVTSRNITIGQILISSARILDLATAGITITITGATIFGSTTTNISTVRVNSLCTVNFTNCTFVSGNGSVRYALEYATSWTSTTFTNCTARSLGGTTIFVTSGLTGSCSGTLNITQDASSTAGVMSISSGSWVLSGSVNHQGSANTLSVSGGASFQYTCTSQTFTGAFTGSGTAAFWSFNTTTTNNSITSPAIVMPSIGSGGSLLRWSGGNTGKVTYTGDVQLGASGPTNFANFNSSALGIIKHVGTLTGANSSVYSFAAIMENAGSSFANGVELVLDRIAPSAANQMPALPPFVRFETTAQLTVQTELNVNHVIAATAAILDMPASSNVRSGTSYNLGTQTGTCAVPPAGSVAFGVPVDATTGTAVLSGGGGSSDWTADEKTAIRAILGVPTSGTVPTDPSSGILDAIRDKVLPLPTDPADASDIASAFGTVNSTLSSIAGYIDTEITDIRNRLPAALVGGKMDSSVGAYQAGQAPLQPATPGRTIYLNVGGQVSSEGDLDAAEIRGALGLGGADLDTQLGEIIVEVGTVKNYVDTEIAAIKLATDRFLTMIVLDGSVYKYTPNALEDAPAGGGSGGTVIVTPTQGTTGNEQSPAADITLSIDAEQTIARVVVDASGDPITIPNNCRLVLCDEFERVITTLNPTITGSSYTAVVPRNVTTQQRTIFFALRVNDSTNAPIDHGTIEFAYVATAP